MKFPGPTRRTSGEARVEFAKRGIADIASGVRPNGRGWPRSPSQVANAPSGRIRCHDPTDTTTAHDVTDSDWRHVLLHVADPNPVGRVNRQLERSNDCFTRPWGRHRRLHEIEIGRFGASGRTLL